jgi:GNAT superfamily N-acetyltransferase
MHAVTLRALTAADVPHALALCRQAGWNQTADDWRLFLQHAPDTCRGASVNGRLVGTVTVLRLDTIAWIGMVLVDVACRRHGIGTMLLEHALDIAGATAIGLDATPRGRPLYERLGFQAACDLIRFERTATHPDPPPPTPAIRRMDIADLPSVVRWDRQIFGANRERLLTHCLARSPHLCWIAVEATDLTGYTFGRTGHEFDQIGPITAASAEICQALATHACAGSTRPLVIDAPTTSDAWRGWLDEQGFRPQRPFTRMFRGATRAGLPGDRVYATLGPEFG